MSPAERAASYPALALGIRNNDHDVILSIKARPIPLLTIWPILVPMTVLIPPLTAARVSSTPPITAPTTASLAPVTDWYTIPTVLALTGFRSLSWMTAGSSAGDAVAHTTARRQTPWSSRFTKAPGTGTIFLFNKPMNGTLPRAGSRAWLCVEVRRTSRRRDSLFLPERAEVEKTQQ
ncbi:hypothetical protein INR49_002330 [Caranx melampygus]|nr:hypothetical protein INR49_002330 [Caranx melampygus]